MYKKNVKSLGTLHTWHCAKYVHKVRRTWSHLLSKVLYHIVNKIINADYGNVMGTFDYHNGGSQISNPTADINSIVR